MSIGETDLRKLLAGMNPELRAEEFVFAMMPTGEQLPAAATVIATFVEREGTTLVLERTEAERLALNYTFPCRMITLRVHSALEAVGFLAAIAAKLTEAGISANTISAYHHDHLFVPADKADIALEVLRGLSKS